MFSVDAPDNISDDLKAKVNAFLNAVATNSPAAGPQKSAKDAIAFGSEVNDLLKAVDWDNRWGYSGSLTTPDCSTKVYHNVLRSILPITLAQLNAVKTFTTAPNAGAKPNFYTETEGNYRRIQPLNADTNVVLMTSNPTTALDELKDSPYLGGFVAFLILFILFMIGFIVACYGWMSARSALNSNEDKQEQELGATN